MNTKVNLAGVELKNPVMVASGTFGSGAEYSEFVDLNRLGAVVTKGVASVPWPGNPAPRIAETASGMLNAIGLQNPGIDLFSKRDLPFLEKYDTKVIVNVCGHSTEEYLDVVERLADEPRVDMLEINISCPNVKEGGIAFGQDPDLPHNTLWFQTLPEAPVPSVRPVSAVRSYTYTLFLCFSLFLFHTILQKQKDFPQCRFHLVNNEATPTLISLQAAPVQYAVPLQIPPSPDEYFHLF